MSDVVEQSLDHVAAFPFDVAGLLADRGFYDGASIERLGRAAPVIRRGKQIAEKLETSILRPALSRQ